MPVPNGTQPHCFSPSWRRGCPYAGSLLVVALTHRIHKTGRKISWSALLNQRDPLSHKFRFNRMWGLRFLHLRFVGAPRCTVSFPDAFAALFQPPSRSSPLHQVRCEETSGKRATRGNSSLLPGGHTRIISSNIVCCNLPRTAAAADAAVSSDRQR